MTISSVFEIAETTSLPINPRKIAKSLGIKIVSYKTFSEIYEIEKPALYEKSALGFTVRIDNRFVIAVNENSCGERRKRFTVAHELGHCVLGHIGGFTNQIVPSPRNERIADKFAAELLAPIPVLILCGTESAAEIKKICGISDQAAEIRFDELVRTRRKNFLLSDENRRLVDIFADFIARYRSEMNRS